MTVDVLVVGGGTMGAGIAEAMLRAGSTVALCEVDNAAAAAALQRVTDGLRRTLRDADDPDAAVTADLARLAVSTDLPVDPPAITIEAVPEHHALKARVLEELTSAYPDGLIATNTSSLSIDALAAHVVRPDRFIGMHFFNPVPRSSLVELVVGAGTGDDTLVSAQAWVRRLGKESIVVRDSPGFATSRLGVALGLEAIRMVEAGVASVQDIDRGMELGYRHPMGPLRLTDLVGLDVRLGIAEHLATVLGLRFSPPELLRTMVAEGKLGKKTGQGFYQWD